MCTIGQHWTHKDCHSKNPTAQNIQDDCAACINLENTISDSQTTEAPTQVKTPMTQPTQEKTAKKKPSKAPIIPTLDEI